VTVVNYFHLGVNRDQLALHCEIVVVVVVVLVIIVAVAVAAAAAVVIIVVSGGDCDAFHEDWIRLAPDNIDSLHVCDQ
jgi:hypothetical protein